MRGRRRGARRSLPRCRSGGAGRRAGKRRRRGGSREGGPGARGRPAETGRGAVCTRDARPPRSSAAAKRSSVPAVTSLAGRGQRPRSISLPRLCSDPRRRRAPARPSSLRVEAPLEERGGHRTAEAQGIDLRFRHRGRLLAHGAAAGAGRQLVERVHRPAAALVLPGHAQKDRLPDGLTREGLVQRELPAVDLRQPFSLDATLPREIEEGGGIGEEGLDPAALGGGEQQEGRSEIAEELARDLGTESRGLLLVKVLHRTADLGVEPAVPAASEGVRSPGRVVRACCPRLAGPEQGLNGRRSALLRLAHGKERSTGRRRAGRSVASMICGEWRPRRVVSGKLSAC